MKVSLSAPSQICTALSLRRSVFLASGFVLSVLPLYVPDQTWSHK